MACGLLALICFARILRPAGAFVFGGGCRWLVDAGGGNGARQESHRPHISSAGLPNPAAAARRAPKVRRVGPDALP